VPAKAGMENSKSQIVNSKSQMDPAKRQSTKEYVRNYQQNLQNKPNFRNAKMNVTACLTRNYDNICACRVPENKPNSKPIQTQTNPICQRVKLMQSMYLQRIMKKNAAKGYEKTNPKQTQFKPNSRKGKK
jgi:hypothetical protein